MKWRNPKLNDGDLLFVVNLVTAIYLSASVFNGIIHKCLLFSVFMSSLHSVHELPTVGFILLHFTLSNGAAFLDPLEVS